MPISLTIKEVKYLRELVAAGEQGRTIAAATSRREVLKRLVEAGYVVSRPMSRETVHYAYPAFESRPVPVALPLA